MVKVSVIMPVYNTQPFLETAIDSVINQTLKDIEIICVDDGSTDNSLEILEKLAEKYPQIKVFHQENGGSGKARNFAIDKSKGEYIAFLDSDDMYLDPNALEMLYNLASTHEVDMVCGNLKRVSLTGELEDNFNYKSGNYYYFDEYYAMLPEEYGIPWAFYKNIFKKSFLDKNNIRFKDLLRGQDPVFLAEILTKVDLILGAHVDFYAYRIDDKNTCNKLNTYTKKFHHISHFKETFEILINGNLIKTFEKFRPQLIYYLEKSKKTNDLTVYEIALNVFGKNPKYFDSKLKKRYYSFLVHHMINKLYFDKSDELFNEIQKDLGEMSINDNDFISFDLKLIIMIILNSKDHKDYQIKLHYFILNQITKENFYLTNENKILKDNIKYIKKIKENLS